MVSAWYKQMQQTKETSPYHMKNILHFCSVGLWIHLVCHSLKFKNIPIFSMLSDSSPRTP